MARTNLPLTKMDPKAPTLNNAGTAVDAANGMNIALASSAIPSAASGDRLVLYVLNTTASTKTVTVRAGAGIGAPSGFGTGYPVPSQEQGLGDLVTGNLTATTGSAFIGPFDTARFIQTDGSINVDFTASMTGTIWAVLLPKYVSGGVTTGG
jgi:hypothetical protein